MYILQGRRSANEFGNDVNVERLKKFFGDSEKNLSVMLIFLMLKFPL
jgi:hypothetical protein